MTTHSSPLANFLALLVAATMAGCGNSELTTRETGTPASSHEAGNTRTGDTLAEENSRLRSQVMALAAENRALTARVAELEAATQGPAPRTTATKTKAATQPPPAKKETAWQPAVPASQPTANEQMASYNAALAKFRAKDFHGALRTFEELISRGIASDLLDNCHYWMGESYYALKKYPMATAEFNAVLDFRESDKARDAMIMLANSYLAEGNNAEAKATLRKLIKTAPGTAVAKRAEAKLRQIK